MTGLRRGSNPGKDTNMPKNANLKARVRKISARDGSTYSQARRRATIFPFDNGEKSTDHVDGRTVRLPAGAGARGLLTFSENVARIGTPATDEYGTDTTSAGNLIVITGDTDILPSDVLGWVVEHNAEIHQDVDDALRAAASGTRTLLIVPGADPYQAVRAVVRRQPQTAESLVGIIFGAVSIHRFGDTTVYHPVRYRRVQYRTERLLLDGTRGRVSGDVAATFPNLLQNVELLVRLGKVTATDASSRFGGLDGKYLAEVEAHFTAS